MSNEIRLAPPGSGLPTPERLVASTLLQGMRLLPKNRLNRWLQHETAGTIALAASQPEPLTSRRVLIPRLAGLEDDSRYWSINMVLQHLVIVTSGIRQLAAALTDGQTSLPPVRIADVKPEASAGPEQQARLRQTVNDYTALIDTLGKRRPAGRHPHPWFGQLDLSGWHALSAMHATAHRRQIQCIVAELNQASIRQS